MPVLAKDSNGKGVQALRPGTTIAGTVTGDTAATFGPFANTTTVVRIVTDGQAHIEMGGATADLLSCILLGGVVEYFRVGPGEDISIYAPGADVGVYVTEMV